MKTLARPVRRMWRAFAATVAAVLLHIAVGEPVATADGRGEADVCDALPELCEALEGGSPTTVSNSDSVALCTDPTKCMNLLGAEQIFTGKHEIPEVNLFAANFVNALRGFDEMADYYTVTQWIAANYAGFPARWVLKVTNELTSPSGLTGTLATGSAAPPTSQCQGSSTQGTTTSWSGSFGATSNTGFISASASGNKTWSQQFELICSDLQINFDSETNGSVVWTYTLSSTPSIFGPISYTMTPTNQWIWKVPFEVNGCTAGNGTQGIDFKTTVELTIAGGPSTTFEVISNVAAPFDQCTLPPPQITGADPSSVQVGELFTIEGTGLFSQSVEAVLIGGNAIDAANYFPVRDGMNDKIKVIAPASAVGENLLIGVDTAGGSGEGGSITIKEASP